MLMTKQFAKALMPCMVACCQAFAATPGITTEAITQEGPAVVQMELNPHKNFSAQLTYMEWRKRLYEARTDVVVNTARSVAVTANPVALQPV